MDGLLVAALAWPAVLPLVALCVGRSLRSADRRDEDRRAAAVMADAVAATPFASSRSASAVRTPPPVGALGALR